MSEREIVSLPFAFTLPCCHAEEEEDGGGEADVCQRLYAAARQVGVRFAVGVTGRAEAGVGVPRRDLPACLILPS